MRAGRLRHRITLQFNSPSRGAAGEVVDSWSDQFTVWASIEPLKGEEFLEGQAQSQKVTYRVEARYRSGFTPEKRLKFTDRESTTRYLWIESVIEPYIRGTDLKLMCREMV